MLREHYEKFEEGILQCLEVIKKRQPSREASLAVTKLQEAWMWFKESNEDSVAPPPAKNKEEKENV